MKKIFSFLLVSLFAVSLSFAVEREKEVAPEAAVSLKGKVMDVNNGEALVGVAVRLNETGNVVYTDFDGNFEFYQVLPGDYTLESALISYENGVEKVKVAAKANNSVDLKLKNL